MATSSAAVGRPFPTDDQWRISTTSVDANLDVLRWFVRRWAVEVTFSEVRRHLGVETQRQWSDPAIARTTPALLGLFSLVTLWADELRSHTVITPRVASWYPKCEATFSDALADCAAPAVERDDFPALTAGPRQREIP